jgi:hypothetical protein
MNQQELDQIKEMARKLEILDSDLRRHFELVADAASLLSKWVEWARVYGHSDHAKGLIDESERMIKP